MLIVGLTGGIASGKSTVSNVLREEGAYLIDADQIAREIVRPHTPTWQELIKTFGEDILQKDGSIQRKKLAAIVFSNPEKRSLLNQLLHPRIREETQRRLKVIGQSDPEAIVVVDAALLVETGDYREMDRLIVVHSTEALQMERLREREGVSPEEAQRMVSAQMPLEEKLKVADFVIRNEGSLEETRRKAKEVFQELKGLAFQKHKKPCETGQGPAHRDKGGKNRGL
ncbi:MAG: dephospho-CoA kinase [Deltaproteobacteria bacterium RBG_16_48_10]|nr:MAG: dephospho-CoA kinase [Deltaproteobacteria bacterium RBG_16_48_10]